MTHIGDRVYASIPEDDPRFTELRAYLEQVKSSGRSSPIARMVGEFALAGFLFMTGRIGSSGQAADLSSFGIADPRELSEAQQAIAEAAAGFNFD